MAVYALGQAFRAMGRHLTSTLATLTTALVSFTLLFLLGLILWNAQTIVQNLEHQLEIAAFLSPKTHASSLLAIIQGWKEVSSVQVISKEEALKQLQSEYPYLTQASQLIGNPLPTTLKVRLKDPLALKAVASRLAHLPGVTNVVYGGETTQRLVEFLNGARTAALVFIALFLLDTLFSVMGTIRLSIESRREEIRVMQLIGASRGFIQGPFVLEGLSLTLVSGVLAALLGGFAYRLLGEALQRLFPFLPVLGNSELLKAGGALVLLGLLIGSLGAFLSSRLHLREIDL